MSFKAPEQDFTVTISSGYRENDVHDLLYYLFKGNVLYAKGYPPPVEFERVLDFFVGYFNGNLDKIDDTALSYAF
jgi:hypothetical protein